MKRDKQLKQIAAVFSAAIVSCSSMGVAGANAIAVDADVWQPSITNNSTIRSGKGSTIHLKNDLGFSEKKSLAGLTLKYGNEDHQSFFLSNTDVKYNGSKQLSQNFTYGGGVFGQGNHVDSEVKVNVLHFGFRNEKVTESGKIATIYQYNHGNIKTRLTDTTAALNRTSDAALNCLNIGWGWESVNARGVNYFAEVLPVTLGNGGNWQYEFGMKVPMGNQLGLKVGYRAERLQTAKTDDDKKRVELRGIFFSLGSSF
ncbi:MAG: hypothetical protein E6713_05445 [Sporomusaceae bacterium]|nr:hypothetical protein [Sporomusaceae bacterium]